jgi:hypothetical protein
MKVFQKKQLFVWSMVTWKWTTIMPKAGLLCTNNIWKSLNYLSRHAQFWVPSSKACSDCGKLYIWFHHYIRKDVGWRLFDHKKTHHNGKLFLLTSFHFLLLFVTFLLLVTLVNYFLLLKWARWVVLLFKKIAQGGKDVVGFIFGISFTVEKAGVWRLNIVLGI